MMRSASKRILFDRLINVYSADDRDELLLGFADCIAHACHMALNPDDIWYQVNPVCLDLLADCIWRGPSYDNNPRLFGIQLRPGPIPSSLIPPTAIRISPILGIIKNRYSSRLSKTKLATIKRILRMYTILLQLVLERSLYSDPFIFLHLSLVSTQSAKTELLGLSLPSVGWSL